MEKINLRMEPAMKHMHNYAIVISSPEFNMAYSIWSHLNFVELMDKLHAEHPNSKLSIHRNLSA